jgi:mRNA interferase RelE/StbE
LAWTIEFDEQAERDLARLDHSIQREIKRYLLSRIAPAMNPRDFGHGLTGELAGLLRYRVRDYRIVCRIEDAKLVVLVIAVGHRSTIYE